MSAAKEQIGASAAAIQSHYDVSDDFFRLWLDQDIVYSAALFEDGDDDLHRAQLRKLDHHIAAANAAGAARVLDVGCGWGAMLKRLVRHAGAGHAVGLTLSASQAEWIRRMSLPNVEVREESWRDHVPEAPYDAIVSIGAFEHFVQPGLTPAAKLEAYREFFAFCANALKPGGRLSLQTIAWNASGIPMPAFISSRIFPETELPLVWEPIAAADGLFELVALRNDRQHYDRTLRMWVRTLTAREAEAVAMVGKETVADFLRYLKMSALSFARGDMALLRMSFAKR